MAIGHVVNVYGKQAVNAWPALEVKESTRNPSRERAQLVLAVPTRLAKVVAGHGDEKRAGGPGPRLPTLRKGSDQMAMNMREKIARAIDDECDRWSCIHGGDLDDVIVRDDDSGDPQEVSRHPAGDGEMYFYDMVNRACATAALRALENPTPDMKMAGAQAITADHMCKAANYDAACDAWSAMIRAAKEDI